MNKIRLEIISPEKTLANLEAYMVIIPGKDGEFGVLLGHENYISTIRPGVVEVYQSEDGISERFVVSLGTAEITPKYCNILVDEAVKVGEIDFDDFAARLATTTENFEKETSEAVKEQLSNRMKYLQEALKFKT